MPEKLHRALNRAALRKFGTTNSKKARAYIYGTLNKNKENKEQEN